MISLQIPGRGELHIKSVVLDYNGTIALDGKLVHGVLENLNNLATILDIYVITADTFGQAAAECQSLNGKVVILKNHLGAGEKEAFVAALGAENVIALGNGANDCLMLKKAALGIAVIGHEGASVKAVNSADIVVKDINEGLGLLLNLKRLKATLRG
ncbi:HAD family hydrolase [Desulforamulus aquiferis]|uniref:HAD hydrolase family protein n=1 Tax=Desulforamulus aquiferis TaxID=1397668 RepID=A0AAW7ZG63_9FIRM|nr:HAD hydrolase family protein [Desulforamulus aquiferis]MDO7787800.1 HAD hydrolase family protein [Desulforamulus aquiferis]RYD02228.1 soluble P-type ATPase [Desulforamulus aquiferis]